MQKIKQHYYHILHFLRNWYRQLKEDKNVFVFLVFLVLSTGFWFLNALQKEYVSVIEYPVKFINIPEGYILKDSKIKDLQLKVEAGGFNILQYHLSGNIIPLNISVAEMTEVKNKEHAGFYLLTSKFFRSINGQLSNGMRLIEISPDTLFINLSLLKKKKVPVRANIKTLFKKQYLQGGKLIIDPDSVTISGDIVIVDSIEEVNTKYKVFEELKDTVQTKLPLEKIEDIKAVPDIVSITIPVEPFTESTLTIPIVAKNVPDTFTLKAFPPEITVSFRVSLSRFEQIKANDFEAAVYFTKDLILDNNKRLKVKLEKYPEGLYFVDYNPLFVEYILEKR